MLDFLRVSARSPKNGVTEVYPKFVIKKSNDLMIRGGDFYAIWNESTKAWSTEEDIASALIDEELKEFADKLRTDDKVVVKYMWDADSGSIDKFHKYCQKQSRDFYTPLDENIIFSNMKTTKEDYSSKKLPYPLEEGSIEHYEELMNTLYAPEERHKIEWAIGAIVTGDSKHIQKFLVLYGSGGTGKSTVLNIIQELFDGYCSVFNAKALGSNSNAFALEDFRNNPLVAIQHDGNLSRIEDNTTLNSLVSHELMTVNEKFKSTYQTRFRSFLLMGTNSPVKITDSKSGIIRRLIDVSPTGNTVPKKRYEYLLGQIKFELGHIAYHCKEVYLANPHAYDDYKPLTMFSATNDFYNFVFDSYDIFRKEDGITLNEAWNLYTKYCEFARVNYPLGRRSFQEELKGYFENYYAKLDSKRCYYEGFKYGKFEASAITAVEESTYEDDTWLKFDCDESLFDEEYADCPAQYATPNEKPMGKWDEVETTLKDIDTSKIHYTKVPLTHIVADFDIPDENGNKCFKKNLEAASKWPKTYAELSKSGEGIHLHYIYNGDPNNLSRVYADHIEIKVFTGNSSLRRKLTKCNDIPIATISSGLPLKGETKVVTDKVIKSERGLRNLIIRNLKKEIVPGTKSSIDFIYNDLEAAYNNGLHYDVSDMRPDIYDFALHSTHQSDYCIKKVGEMHFKSDEISENCTDYDDDVLVFYDVEVFPNLFLVNWKKKGENYIHRMINPTPEEIRSLTRYKLIGFNCRRYDNHILYARIMGYNNLQLYKLSQRIINQDKDAFFGEAYNISYTDIYDFASSGNKKSLKKLEIEMSNIASDNSSDMDETLRAICESIQHKELGLKWDEEVPVELWDKVAEYCDNDVKATEAAFAYLEADWTARQILADLAGGSVNDTTNSLTQKIIFGRNKNPQVEFFYRDLSKPVFELDNDIKEFLDEACPDMMSKRHGKAGSILPYWDGYIYNKYGKAKPNQDENDKEKHFSWYRGEDPKEGGYVYAEPGIYYNVGLLDIASMHPHSAIAECLFGKGFTKAFREIVEGRVSIKHKAWDEVNNILDGKLTPFIQKVIDGEMSAKQLANALKTAINSVYGLTSAKFTNAFKDERNIDNIVAKRGALFMIDLKHEVQDRGFTVVHIKTDSIKIANATPEIIKFCMDFAKDYGYTFEHEATYEKMCIVNDAVYIAKYAPESWCLDHYGYLPTEQHEGEWTATGTQFQVPYVFKTLFSHEDIKFHDLCEVKSVSTSLYLDMNENLINTSDLEHLWELRNKPDDKLTRKDKEYLAAYNHMSDEDVLKGIDDGHNYQFVGKVGQFCPMKEGSGGGYLLREKDGKYYSATGALGFKWMESDTVKAAGLEDKIDRTYYNQLVDEAVATISEYGDFEQFAA